jgi:hypothetical protein
VTAVTGPKNDTLRVIEGNSVKAMLVAAAVVWLGGCINEKQNDPTLCPDGWQSICNDAEHGGHIL